MRIRQPDQTEQSLVWDSPIELTLVWTRIVDFVESPLVIPQSPIESP